MSASPYIPPTKIPDWLSRIISLPANRRLEYLLPIYQSIEEQEETRVSGFAPAQNPDLFDPKPFSTALLPHNNHRNRYSDILPFNYNRVKLKVPTNLPAKFKIEASDYINASHVGGFKNCDPYIATQGPVDHTVGDFWRMVDEQKSRVILMLTPLVENKRVKCAKYWPDVGCEYNLKNVNLNVKNLGENVNDCVIIRRLLVNGNQVLQIHFEGWADHRAGGVDSVLNVVKIAEDLQGQALGIENDVGPMVVHCSAGCGRTGTYITIASAIKGANGPADVVYETVKQLREQRVSMVQTAEQYVFCYEAVCRGLNK